MEGYQTSRTQASSDTNTRDTPGTSSSHRPTLHHVSSELERQTMSITTTNTANMYLPASVSVPAYQGSHGVEYAAHIPNIPTCGYNLGPPRFTSHLTSTSSLSGYGQRSYAFNSTGYDFPPRHDFSYGRHSQPYTSQSQQPSLRTDSETYNAALALVQSQSKMFTEESAGQYYHLDSGSSTASNYEPVHDHLLVSNLSQNVSMASDQGHDGNGDYASEKPHMQAPKESENIGTNIDKSKNSNECATDSCVKVVVETVESVSDSNKPSALQDETLDLLQADRSVQQDSTQLIDIAAEETSTSRLQIQTEVQLNKQISVNREVLTNSSDKFSKTYKNTASQIEGPDLESRFGVLIEELREFQGSKACYIKLKPVKKSYLDSSCDSVVFDIEIENELFVSSIEKTFLTDKMSSYSFKISSCKGNKLKSTSETDYNDKVSSAKLPEKDTGSDILKEKDVETLKESKHPEVKNEKEEVFPDKVITRASKRKATKPLKNLVSKESVNLEKKLSPKQSKIISKHGKTNKKFKSSKTEVRIETSKEDNENKSTKKESKTKKSKSKSKSSKKLLDLEDDADKFDDFSNVVQNATDQEKALEKKGSSFKEERTEITIKIKGEPVETHGEVRTIKTDTADGQVESGGEILEKPVFKSKRKKKIETDADSGESRPKRKYNKRMVFDKTELNYTVRKTETGSKVFVCNICGYESKQTGNMRSHLRCRHTEERPFKCQYCPKSFSSQSNLRGHWTIHKDERPYLCSICGTAFKANSNLVKHIQRHLGDKRFSCSTCGKQFVTSTDLRRHFRVHSSEKAFLCELCPKSFKDATSLSRHAVCHTGQKNYLCTFCGDAFARKDNCYTHMKKHHSHETDTIPPPPKRLEHYMNSPDLSETEEPEKNKEPEFKPDLQQVEQKPATAHNSDIIIAPLENSPVLPTQEHNRPVLHDNSRPVLPSPMVATDVYIDNDHHHSMEPQIPVTHMGKVQEGTYTQLMAVNDMSALNACKLPPQQPYDMYIPMSMQGPSW